MHSELRKVQSLHEPQRVVIEELKVLKNQKTLVSLGIAQGMLISACGNVPVEFVSPSVWRKSFGLSGLKREEAKKGAIAKAQSLGYSVANDDEAEAVLIGIHYANNSKNTFRDFKVLKRSISRAQRK